MKLAMCLLVSSALCLGLRPAQGQDQSIRIQAYNGKTGVPLMKQRLLVFAGATQQDAAFHQKNFDLTTDSNGEATLVLNSPDLQWVQVFADYLTLCQSTPNYRSFNVSEIVSTGASSPNACSKVTKPNEAGKFIVFARPATNAEKMRR